MSRTSDKEVPPGHSSFSRSVDDNPSISVETLAAQHALFLALSQVRDLDETLRLCLKAVLQTSGLECGGIYLVDVTGGLRLVHAEGLSEAFVAAACCHATNTPHARLMMAGNPVYERPADWDLTFAEWERQEGLRAFALVPLRRNQQIIGCVTIASRQHAEVDAINRIPVETMASIIGLLIGQAQADAALRESEARFQATFEQAAVGIAHVAPDGHWLRVNQKLCDIVGYSHSELLSHTFQDITHPDDVENDVESARKVLSHEVDTYTKEKRYVRKDGRPIWVNLTVSLVSMSDGSPDYFIAVIEDIQTRKETEEKVRQFSRVVEQTASTIVITDSHGFIEYVNPRFTQTTGYTAKEAIGKRPNLLKSGHTSDDEYRQLWRTILSGNVWTGELLNRRKDGTTYWESAIISPVRDEYGRITQFLAIKDDVTERKRGEEALKQSESTLLKAQRMAHIGNWQWDYQADQATWSDEVYRIFGRDPALVAATYSEIAHYFSVESWQRLSAAIKVAIQAGTPYDIDVEIVRPDGTKRWALAHGEPILDDNGTVIELHGMIQDITPRKGAEMALRQSEERLRLFVDHAPAAIAMFDTKMRYLVASKRWMEDYRLGDRDIVGHSHYEIFPEITERWKNVHQRALSGEVVRAEEDRFERADGSVQWLRWEVRPWYSDGTVDGVVIFTEDITERKLSSAEIEEREARYRAVIETTTDGFWMVGDGGELLAVNDAYVRRSGYSREELLSMHIMELDANESSDDVRSHISKIERVGNDLFESRHRARDGSVWPVEVNASYWPDAGGRFFAFLRDITERKALERQVIEISTAEQERIGREIHDGIGQKLTAIGMLANRVERRLTAGGQLADAKAAHELVQYLQEVVGDARALARGLSPVQIGPTGLADALSVLVNSVHALSEIGCHLTMVGEVGAVDEHVLLHLYRIVQEAVNNAVKHAKASAIDVQVISGKHVIVISVSDNGIGFDVSNKMIKGIGTRIMRYRANLIGASLSIMSGHEHGTVVECAWRRQ